MEEHIRIVWAGTRRRFSQRVRYENPFCLSWITQIDGSPNKNMCRITISWNLNEKNSQYSPCLVSASLRAHFMSRHLKFRKPSLAQITSMGVFERNFVFRRYRLRSGIIFFPKPNEMRSFRLEARFHEPKYNFMTELSIAIIFIYIEPKIPKRGRFEVK